MSTNQRNKGVKAKKVTNSPKTETVKKVSATVAPEVPKTVATKEVKPAAKVVAKTVTKVAPKVSAKPPVEEVRKKATKKTTVKPKEVVANIVDISNINLQEALGGAEIKVLHGVAKKSAKSYPVNTVLLNLGPVKVVKVRYTEDDWQNIKEHELKYEKTVENDLEIWGATVPLEAKSTDKFHYAVSYEVNGMTYWDNNLGQNHNF